LTGVEFEGPRVTVRSDIETTQARQGHAPTFFEGFVQRLGERVKPDFRRLLVGAHALGQAMHHVFFLYALAQEISSLALPN